MPSPSIHFSEDHEEFRRTARKFLEQEVAPHADAWEEAGRIPRSIFRKLGELGFLGICFPEAYGGSEADIFFALAFVEELPRSMMGGFCGAVTVQQFMATQHIYKFGSEPLKQRFLVPSIEGRKVGALAVTEPDTGSDVAAIRTRALRDGDSYLVNGAKTFITNGADGDFYTLAVKTSPEAGSGGISLLVVEADSPGVTVARRLKKLGLKSSDTAELAFEDVRVPAANLVGQENMGFYYLMEAFQLERLISAAISVGSCDVCIEQALRYMKERQVFGRPLTRFQVLTHRIADLATEVEAARQLCYQAAWMLENGLQPVRECSMAKLLASELSVKVSNGCLQAFGGYGYMEEYPLARFYRDARSGTIVAGSSEIMREIIARIMFEGAAPPKVAQRPEPPQEQSDAPAAPTPEQSPEQAAQADEPVTVAALFGSLAARMRKERTAGWTACFHYRIAGCEQPEWTVRIDDDSCTVHEGLQGQPDCLVELDEQTYLGIETGSVNPQVAFMMGGIKVSNIEQMMRYVKCFRPAFRA